MKQFILLYSSCIKISIIASRFVWKKFFCAEQEGSGISNNLFTDNMKHSQWIGLAAAVLVIIACYLPWVEMEAFSTVLTGMDGKSTNLGKPGKLHIILCIISSLFFVVPFLWAKRINWFFCAMGVAWALRNMLIYARCEMGNCPTIKYGLYIVLIGSLIMLVASFLPDIKIKEKVPSKRS